MGDMKAREFKSMKTKDKGFSLKDKWKTCSVISARKSVVCRV